MSGKEDIHLLTDGVTQNVEATSPAQQRYTRAVSFLEAVFTCALFVCTAVTIAGQTVKTTKTSKALAGPLHADALENVIVVYLPGDEWKIALATLPFSTSDCSAEAEAVNQSISTELSGCGHEPMVVASSLSPPKVFFTVWVGTYAQNVPHILFEADVARRSIRRVLGAGSGIEDVVVSPSGGYLAYSVGWSSGVCHHTSSVFVADLGTLTKTNRPAAVAEVDMASPSMLANAVSWATRESLVFRESKFEGDDSCRRHPWQTKTADTRSLHFH